MKKSILFLFLLASSSAFALPVGNPAAASLIHEGVIWEGAYYDPCDEFCDGYSIRMGFYGDYVFNRHLEIRNDGRQIEQSQLFTNAVLFAFNLWDRLDIFTTLGATTLDIEGDSNLFAPALGGLRATLHSTKGFSWSVGSDATLWDWGCLALGIEGQFFFWDPAIERLGEASQTTIYPNTRARYREWQVGMGFSRKFAHFVPYIAIKYARATLTFDPLLFPAIGPTEGRLHELRSSRHLGLACGISLIEFKKIGLTAEGRFFDEKAIHINAQMRF